MGQFYNITNADRVSTWRSRYATGEGDDMQDWFLRVDGINKPIKQTTKIDSPMPSGQTYGSMEVTMSKKGSEYYKFKREQVPEGMEIPRAERQPQGGSVAKVATEASEILTLLRDIHKAVVPQEIKPQRKPIPRDQEDVVLDDIDEEPADLSDIPF